MAGKDEHATAERRKMSEPEEGGGFCEPILGLRGVAGVATVFEFDWQSALSFGRLEAVSGERVVQGRCYLGGYLMRYLIQGTSWFVGSGGGRLVQRCLQLLLGRY